MWRELTVIEQCKFSINENNNRSKLTNVVLFLGLILIGSIILSGAVSAAGLNTSPQPKFHHDNNTEDHKPTPQNGNTLPEVIYNHLRLLAKMEPSTSEVMITICML